MIDEPQRHGEKEKVMEKKRNDLFDQQEFESHQFTTLLEYFIFK